MSASFNVIKSKQLLERALHLPTNIIDDVDFPNHRLPEDEKNVLTERYHKKRSALLGIVEQLMLETRSFIKTTYGPESEYFKWVHKIDFTTEGKGYIMNTFNVNHNAPWREGKQSLISLLSNITFEEEAKAERESFGQRTVPYFQLCLFAVIFLVALIVVWQIPASELKQIIANDKVIQSRAVMSICIGCLSLIIVKPESWKELFAAFIAAALIFIPLLK